MYINSAVNDIDNFNLGASILCGIVAYSGTVLHNTYKIHRDAKTKNVRGLKIEEIKQRNEELRIEKKNRRRNLIKIFNAIKRKIT